MKDFKILKLVDLFKTFYEKAGVDYNIMRKILQLKLTMDGRRVSSVMGKNKKQDETKDKNNYLMLLAFNMFISFFIAMATIIRNIPVMMATNIVIGITLFMLVSLMISDFSAVLLDVKEKNILLPKPISNKTFNAAKVTHIFLYLMGLSVSFSVIPLVIGTIRYGIVFFLILFIEIFIMAAVVIALTAMVYTIVLNFFDGEKLKDIINYFQIFLAFIFAFGYQFMNRIFDIGIISRTEYVAKPWHVLLPSMWFSAPFGFFMDGYKQPIIFVLLILLIVAPVILIIFYLKIVVPYFEKSLQKLNDNGNSISRGKNKRQDFIANIICVDNIEKAMFKFTQNMIDSERSLKLKIYPSLAMAVFMPLFFIFPRIEKGQNFITSIRGSMGGYSHLSMYCTILLLCFCTAFISNSDSYKGAWIYKALPIETPGALFKGAIKATLCKLIIPLYIVESIIFLLINGVTISLDIVIMFFVLIFLALLYFKLANKTLPFTVKFATSDSGKLLLPSLVTLLLLGIFFGIHIVIKGNILYRLIYAVILLGADVVVWNISFNIKWKDVE
ncbi:hypothetical protein SAMN02745163_04444 [Clostridium cavendishii DSM 21758]|uniref:ABC-2 type transport system permease protein n=1 Tax=Clostridium cavendishii DSM 21758 TaxID=1121302 RepID=A0A1M6V7W9_9CLOT|nr:hypothetical protein [Clostridium cavendishii]SHK77553.1 hypothetical protein SAMN02745163_04444 [Clostridium cavendishii DSM 21758]